MASSSEPIHGHDRIGRYVLHSAIARGGMATVHAAHLVASAGVTRLVAVKRLHPHFTDDPDFVEMFEDEARIASRIHHPNVVPVLDVVREGDELILVQEYVHGLPLSQLFKMAIDEEPIPVPIVASIVCGILAGLHAAHECTDELGHPLDVVHRDVSPQNVIVSVDGISRVVDFGIAKAKSSVHHTREGFFKGKLAYMGPEHMRGEKVSRAADIYAVGVVLWELLVNRKYYDGKNEADFVRAVAMGSTPTVIQALALQRGSMPEERWAEIVRLEPIVTRALSIMAHERWETAAEMADELRAAVIRLASIEEVATYVRTEGADYLERREKFLQANEEGWRSGLVRSTDVEDEEDEDLLVDLSSNDDDDDNVPSVRSRSSGARMRVANGPLAPSFSDRPTMTAIPTPSALRPLGRPHAKSWSATLAARAQGVPWSVVAALLVIIGVLVGVVIVRERAPMQVAPAVAVQAGPAAPSPHGTTPIAAPTETECAPPPVVNASIVSVPTVSPPTAPTPTPSPSPPPNRFRPTPRAAPVPTPISRPPSRL